MENEIIEEKQKPKTKRSKTTNKDGFEKGKALTDEEYFKYIAQKRLRDAKER